MGSRGWKRQLRRERARIRPLLRAEQLRRLVAYTNNKFDEMAASMPGIPGLDGLLRDDPDLLWPERPRVVGTIGGKARTNPLLVR